MDEKDCLVVYDQLIELLEEFNLGWVVEQIEDVIGAGKISEEIVSGRKTPDLKLTYYSPEEQLLLLISAIEQVVLNTIEFEAKIQANLEHETKSYQLKPELCFTSALKQQRKTIQLIPESLKLRQTHCKQLQALLNQLKQEVIPNAH
ncbi:MAG: hypothetical protein WBA77_11100 [Microcoleaceae cyanobacterium]